MKKKTKADEDTETLVAYAATAFSAHKIQYRGERIWRLMSQDKEGHWRGSMAAEIVISPEAGALLVLGDIELCAFRYGSGEDKGKVPYLVDWIAGADLHYLSGKAGLGMNTSDICTRWSWTTCEADLNEAITETTDAAARNVYLEILGSYGFSSRAEFLHDALDIAYRNGADIDAYGVGRFGERIAPRIIYARAAVQRLRELLVAE